MSDLVERVETPEADRPWMPKGYGMPTSEEGMMKWDDVNEILKSALNYWIATTTKDGRPHVRPVWAAWSNNKIYFDGSPETGWGRNINRDPRISVQVEAGDITVMVEGTIESVDTISEELANTLLGECLPKYKPKYNYDHTEEAKGWREHGMFILHPHKIFAWDVATFGTSPARFTFDEAATEAINR